LVCQKLNWTRLASIASVLLIAAEAARSEVVITNTPARTSGGSLVFKVDGGVIVPKPKWLIFTTGGIPSQINSLMLGFQPGFAPPHPTPTPLPISTGIGISIWSTVSSNFVPLPLAPLTSTQPLSFTISTSGQLYEFGTGTLGGISAFTLNPYTTYGLALSGLANIPISDQPRWSSTGNTGDPWTTAPSGQNGFSYQGFAITQADGTVCAVRDDSDPDCGVPWNAIVLNVSLLGITPGMTTNASDPASNLLSGGTVIVDKPGSFSTNYTLAPLGGIIDINGLRSSFTGVFSGNGPLNFSNNSSGGSITLDGNSNYSSSTTVQKGATLLINGSIASSSGLTVQSGGTIGGSGTLPTTTVQEGGILAPGNSIGTLTVSGSFTLNPGSIADFEVTSSSADKLVATGAINLSGSLNLAFSGGGFDITKPYILFSGSSVSGAFSSISTFGNLLGYRYAISNRPTAVEMSLTKILASGMTTPITAPWSTTFAGGTLSIDAPDVYGSNWILDTPTGSTVNTIDQNGISATLSGSLSGPSDVTFVNTAIKRGGSITLSGNSNYTGSTTVEKGARLLVNGSIASSSGLTVQSGGTIGGSGTLPSTTINAGASMAPGNSIGKLTVNGNYSLDGGTLAIEVQGPQSDQVVVTGNVSPMNGSATLISYGGGNAWPGFAYTILSSNNSPPFTTAQSLKLDQSKITPSALLQLGTTLVQEADSNPNTFDVQWRPVNGNGAVASAMQAVGAYNSNTRSAASVFDSSFNRLVGAAVGNANATGTAIGSTGFTTAQAKAAGLSSDFMTRLGDLLAITSGMELQQAVTSITAESYAAFQSVGLNALRLQRETLSARAGSCRVYGWVMNSEDKLKRSVKPSPNEKSSTPLCIFATGGNATSNIIGSNELSGYDSAIAGGFYGVEVQTSKQWTIGAAYGYGTAALSNLGAGNNSVNSTVNSGSIYGVYKPDAAWTIKGLLGYGNYNVSGIRRLIAIGNGNSITGNTMANGYTGNLQAEYAVPLSNSGAKVPLLFKPQIGVAYGAYQQYGFSEVGDPTMNLNLAGHTSQSLVGTVGAEVAAAIPLNSKKSQVLKPRLAVAYQVDALANSNNNTSLDASLPSAGVSFTSTGQSRGVNDLTISGTLEYVVASKASLYASASYEIYSTGNQFAYGGGVRLSF
jgi:hypothetical protein